MGGHEIRHYFRRKSKWSYFLSTEAFQVLTLGEGVVSVVARKNAFNSFRGILCANP